ncbi:hypothetical protein ACFQU2_39270 [Siccirubricoccus deserti]
MVAARIGSAMAGMRAITTVSDTTFGSRPPIPHSGLLRNCAGGWS